MFFVQRYHIFSLLKKTEKCEMHESDHQHKAIIFYKGYFYELRDHNLHNFQIEAY